MLSCGRGCLREVGPTEIYSTKRETYQYIDNKSSSLTKPLLWAGGAVTIIIYELLLPAISLLSFSVFLHMISTTVL